MHDTGRVHRRQSLQRLPRVARRAARRDALVARPADLDDGAQRLPVQQLDGEERLVVLGDAGPEQRCHVVMADALLHLRLACEPLARGRIVVDRDAQDLDRDVRGRVEVERAIHVGHRALADHRIEPKPLADHLADAVGAITRHGATISPGICYRWGVPRHLVSIADLDAGEIVAILDHGDRYMAFANEPIKKLTSLRGRTVINLFFESSTRTRTSFELAAKRLSAEAINIAGSSSSTTKGETLLDTADNLEAMHPDAIVVRHSFGGAAAMLAREV